MKNHIKRDDNAQKGLILFKDIRETIKAEEVLKRAGFDIRIVAPPPEVRIGCDLAIEFNVIDEMGVKRTLHEYNVRPLEIILLKDANLKPLDIIKEVSFGDYLMIKAGHVKLTFNRKNGEIVNISGGGCPDIPYLALSLIGKKLGETKRPRELGFTLCAYMLDKAYMRALEIFKGARNKC